ncbi:tail fiber assembly protein [Shigella sonnei]|nr:tail fiber assembly protein [Shigella sonnei]
MMHLKNIKAGNPKTPEQYQLTKKAGVVWLFCEDGKNWYEEQKNFQPDTIKIAYDENNIIVAVSKDVSTINPEGLSIVEVPDITANRHADNNGTTIWILVLELGFTLLTYLRVV